MAVTKVPVNTTCRIVFNTGTDPESGNPVLRRKSLSNVKPTASDQDIFDVASAIGGLCEYETSGIQRVDSAQLVQE